MYEKICLLTLMNMAFERSSTDRQMSFVDVSKRTGLAMDKVEILVMKAMSRKLIKGKIDQVEFPINVSTYYVDLFCMVEFFVIKFEWSKSKFFPNVVTA